MRKANAWICVIEWNGIATQRAKGYCFPPYVFSIQGSKIDTYITHFGIWDHDIFQFEKTLNLYT